jgi:hypothetical protein
MMRWSMERSMNLYPFTLSGYKKNTLSTLWIKCLPILRGNPRPCMRTEYMEVGHFRFEATPSLEGGFILDRSMGRSILDVGFLHIIISVEVTFHATCMMSSLSRIYFSSQPLHFVVEYKEPCAATKSQTQEKYFVSHDLHTPPHYLFKGI